MEISALKTVKKIETLLSNLRKTIKENCPNKNLYIMFSSRHSYVSVNTIFKKLIFVKGKDESKQDYR